MASETAADRRLHPSSIWLAAIRQIRGWLPLAGIFILINLTRDGGLVRILKWTPAAIMVVLLSGGISALIAYISWKKFRYGIGERDIVIESGVFSRVRRNIPLARVQDVNIEQGLLARLFGLAKVNIETGGGQKDEGVLDSVSMAEADRLREVIRGRSAGAPEAASKPGAQAAAAAAAAPVAAAAAHGNLVYQMTLGRVLIAGLFSFSLFYLAAAYAVIEGMADFFTFDLFSPSTWRQVAGSATVQNVSLLILAIIVLGVVAGAGRTIIRDYGFKLWKEGRKFRRERGLLTRSQVVVSLPRVQLAKVSTGPVRRLFDWFELSLQTLGGAVEDASGRQSIAPFAKDWEVAEILKETGPFRMPDKAALNRVSSRSLLRKLAPLVIPTLVLMIVSTFLPAASFGLLVVMLIAVLTALEWRLYRYAYVEGLLFVSTGVIKQTLWIAPPTSAQTVTLSRSIVQRMLGLASVIVDTAGAGVMPLGVHDLKEATARELVATLMAASKPGPPKKRRRSKGPKAPS